MAEARGPGEFKPDEVRVRDAVRTSQYSHSYIIRLIKGGSVEGRLIETVAGKIWVVNSHSLLTYKQQEHKTGPKGPLKKRRQAQSENGEPTKTDEAA